MKGDVFKGRLQRAFGFQRGVIDHGVFDANGRATTVGVGVYGGSVLAHWDYTRDAEGSVIDLTRGSGSTVGADRAFSYGIGSDLVEVTDVTTPANSAQFGYDPGGHPTVLGDATQTFTPSGELCWSAPTTAVAPGSGCDSTPPAGATSYTYDPRGLRVGAQWSWLNQSFTWDANNQLSAASVAGLPNFDVTYVNAPDGLRTSKTVDGVTTTFAWDVTAPVAQLVQDGNNYYLYGPDGLPTERVGASATMFLHQDAYGSTRLTTDTSGTVTSTQTFDAWGNPQTVTGTPPSLGWNSQYLDNETSLYYLRNRYYHPATAQFISPDPLDAITRDRYGYAANNPINSSDPMGLWCVGSVCTDGITDAVSDAWDATGGKAVTYVNTHRHQVVDIAIGTAIAAGATFCIAGTAGLAAVACVGGAIAVGTGLDAGAHLAVNASTPGTEGDFGVYQAIGHGLVTSGFGGSCALLLGAGCGGALAGFGEYGFAGSFIAAGMLGLAHESKHLVDQTQNMLNGC